MFTLHRPRRPGPPTDSRSRGRATARTVPHRPRRRPRSTGRVLWATASHRSTRMRRPAWLTPESSSSRRAASASSYLRRARRRGCSRRCRRNPTARRHGTCARTSTASRSGPRLASEADPLGTILQQFAPLPKALLELPPATATTGARRSKNICGRQRSSALHAALHRVARNIGPASKPWAARCALPVDVTFSGSSSSTDTLAGAPDGGPFRDNDGRLVFRPGGHGAASAREPERPRRRRPADQEHRQHHASSGCGRTARWKAILLGVLQASRAADRPTRVCGVVRNTGEPGGGPPGSADAMAA